MDRDRSPVLSPESVRLVAGVATVLLLFALGLKLRGGDPLGVVSPHHIVWLFAASNYAASASSLLQLWAALRGRHSSAALSQQSSRLSLFAVILRAAWSLTGTAFRTSWFANLDVLLSVGTSLALNAALSPTLGPAIFGCAPVKPDSFPSFSVFGVVLSISVCSYVLGLSDAQQDGGFTMAMRWVCLGTAIYTQAAAVLPQRAALARAKKVEAITAHAVALLALGALFRMAMWLALMLESEFHMLLMLGDFAFIGLLADFLLAYAGAVSSSGLEAGVTVNLADMI